MKYKRHRDTDCYYHPGELVELCISQTSQCMVRGSSHSRRLELSCLRAWDHNHNICRSWIVTQLFYSWARILMLHSERLGPGLSWLEHVLSLGVRTALLMMTMMSTQSWAVGLPLDKATEGGRKRCLKYLVRPISAQHTPVPIWAANVYYECSSE